MTSSSPSLLLNSAKPGNQTEESPHARPRGGRTNKCAYAFIDTKDNKRSGKHRLSLGLCLSLSTHTPIEQRSGQNIKIMRKRTPQLFLLNTKLLGCVHSPSGRLPRAAMRLSERQPPPTSFPLRRDTAIRTTKKRSNAQRRKTEAKKKQCNIITPRDSYRFDHTFHCCSLRPKERWSRADTFPRMKDASSCSTTFFNHLKTYCLHKCTQKPVGKTIEKHWRRNCVLGALTYRSRVQASCGSLSKSSTASREWRTPF